MKHFKHDNGKEFHNASMAKPPFGDVGQVVDMPRAAPNGMSGNSVALSSNATYGIGGYDGPDKIVEMPRAAKAAMGGSGASSLPPATADYGVKGYDDMNAGKQCYGISGVPGGDGQGGRRSSLRPAGGTR